MVIQILCFRCGGTYLDHNVTIGINRGHRIISVTSGPGELETLVACPGFVEMGPPP